MRWCLPAEKTRFQLRILNVPLGKSHIVVWALICPSPRKIDIICKKNIFEKSTLHFGT